MNIECGTEKTGLFCEASESWCQGPASCPMYQFNVSVFGFSVDPGNCCHPNDNNCVLSSGESCTVTCDSGFEPKSGTSGLYSCEYVFLTLFFFFFSFFEINFFCENYNMTSFFLLLFARLLLLVCSGNIGTLTAATLTCVINCAVATPAVYGPWIGDCANLGDKRSHSQVVLVYPVNGGTPCPAPVFETCPVVDCESHYDAWSTCNSKGKETRLVIIDRENSGGGAACPANQERLCKVDCVVRCVALHFVFCYL